MKAKIYIPPNVAIYLRFSTEEQANAFDEKYEFVETKPIAAIEQRDLKKEVLILSNPIRSDSNGTF